MEVVYVDIYQEVMEDFVFVTDCYANILRLQHPLYPGSSSGGICGANCGTENGECFITNCYTNVDTIGQYAGGMCGYRGGCNGKCFITNCYTKCKFIKANGGGICGMQFACCIKQEYTNVTINNITDDVKSTCCIANCYTIIDKIFPYAGGISGFKHMLCI